MPPPDGWHLIYGSQPGSQNTVTSHATSDDLMHWTRLGYDLEFKPDARWYNVDQGRDSRWDCIFTTPHATDATIEAIDDLWIGNIALNF